MEAHVDTFKIRVKVGTHEFEAEGSREFLEQQVSIFKELVDNSPKTADGPKDSKPQTATDGTPTSPEGNGNSVEQSKYEKLFSTENGRVSLHFLPDGEQREGSSVLLLLLGHRVLLAEDSVLSGRLLQGLEQSGLTLDRIDRFLEAYIGGPSGLIIRSGVKKGTKYRLTNLGLARAKTIAEGMLGMVA